MSNKVIFILTENPMPAGGLKEVLTDLGYKPQIISSIPDPIADNSVAVHFDHTARPRLVNGLYSRGVPVYNSLDQLLDAEIENSGKAREYYKGKPAMITVDGGGSTRKGNNAIAEKRQQYKFNFVKDLNKKKHA